ncbi:SigF/SigG family RNA polymerase sporulation sigma factor [Calorimonas adulescens]|uniref:SigB/SigF/SigG family RNA polymerase sigma factor n=1 Tax=Calorimonas adulescens TaxID=2606906 RepID=A0A5D8QBY8_9THEO|nr:SigF/SigG family RNA polymerase sporulation sigma factor [Calorimonas adulescens]TZE82032.1 SigB/SigF/SigG family RNA polymerase sigma factor [Calorimonas adulescens]
MENNNLELIKRAQSNDKTAQEQLIKNNIGLVKGIVKRFLGRGYEEEDLFQIGCTGLLKAIKRFDVSYGVKFSTYAVPMIIGEIKRFLRDDNIIKVGRSTKEKYLKVKYASEELTYMLGREPTVNELAEHLNMKLEELVLVLNSENQPLSLNESFNQENDEDTLLDKISDNYNETDIINSLALKEAINKLEARERQIIILRYFKDMTQSQVSQIMGISQVQVSRIEKSVLNKIKNELNYV